MTQEEKANAYDEALGKARRYYDEYKTRDNILYVEDMEDMFPELKESEDERIRKWIIGILSTYEHDRDFRNAAIDWLEKQGKYDFNFPKNYQDSSHPNGGIVLEDFNGGEGFYKLHLDYLNKKQVEEVEEMVRVWNKELKTPNENIKSCIGMCLTDIDEQRFADFNTNLKECLDWLEKQGKQKETLCDKCKKAQPSHSCQYITALGRCYIENINTSTNKVKPKDYNTFDISFNAKDSELKEASYNIPEGFYAEIESNRVVIKRGEQKPAWSEEDEQYKSGLIGLVENSKAGLPINLRGKAADKCIYWLKSLKDRVQPQLKQEWGEEDERNLNDAILFIETGTYSLDKDNLINWLKSLKKIHLEAE